MHKETFKELEAAVWAALDEWEHTFHKKVRELAWRLDS
jgi:hypothetical protein